MIDWKDGVICFASGKQWFRFEHFDLRLINDPDFQLNEIRIGDYIEKSELDTEQKYNDVVEVFELFGFDRYDSATYQETTEREWDFILADNECDFIEVFELPVDSRKLTHNQITAIGKLKRMMNEREEVKRASEAITGAPKATTNKYEREISGRQGNSATVDVYDVLKAFNVTCPATQHAVKKLLCSGIRGHKDLTTDLIEAKESIVRAIELNG